MYLISISDMRVFQEAADLVVIANQEKLHHIGRAREHDPVREAGAAFPKIGSQSSQPESSRKLPSFKSCHQLIDGRFDTRLPYWAEPLDTPVKSGGCVITHPEALQRVEMFQERLG